jgi:hypothetical protein
VNAALAKWLAAKLADYWIAQCRVSEGRCRTEGGNAPGRKARGGSMLGVCVAADVKPRKSGPTTIETLSAP